MSPEIANKVLKRLLTFPLQRDEDIALAFKVNRSTAYRRLHQLMDAGLVEAFRPGLGKLNSRPLYYLTHAGICSVAAQEALDAARLAHYWGADEAGVLSWLPRLDVLYTLQDVVNSLVRNAAQALSHEGRRPRLTWHWRRDWQHSFALRDHPTSCSADAILVFLPKTSRLTDETSTTPLILLIDPGWQGSADHLIIERKLERLLRYRESPERVHSYSQFPPVAIVVPSVRQQEHWQRIAADVAARLHVAPLQAAIAPLATGEQFASAWSLPWQGLESRVPCQLQSLLVSVPKKALPPEVFPSAQHLAKLSTPPTRKERLIVRGHLRERLKQVTIEQQQPPDTTTLALLGASLSRQQQQLLHLMYIHPLLSTDDLAALVTLLPATAARMLYDLHWRKGCLEQETIGRQDRWRLSDTGLRLLARQLDVPVQHLAERVPEGPLTQRGVPLLRQIVKHTAGIYQFVVQLQRAAEEHDHRLRWWERGIWCERRFVDQHAWHNLRPDAALEYQWGEQRFRAWVEWDEGTMPSTTLAAKFYAYAHYVQSREWFKERHPLPLLLFITPDVGRERAVRELAAILSNTKLLVWTTTATRLANKGPLGAIWAPAHHLEQPPAQARGDRRTWLELNRAA